MQPDLTSDAVEGLVRLKAPQQTNIFMTVKFGNKEVQNGDELKATDAGSEPSVSWEGNIDGLFTLAMVNLDAPGPKEPVDREWRHWIVCDIPGNEIRKGKVLSSFAEPAPPKSTGLHRFVIALFKQKDQKALRADTFDDYGSKRGKFKLADWASSHSLEPCVIQYFGVQSN